jgi:hypothetical protein
VSIDEKGGSRYGPPFLLCAMFAFSIDGSGDPAFALRGYGGQAENGG